MIEALPLTGIELPACFPSFVVTQVNRELWKITLVKPDTKEVVYNYLNREEAKQWLLGISEVVR